MTLRTCISPQGTFRYAIHSPSYTVANLREHDHLAVLGSAVDGTQVSNKRNFPAGNVLVEQAAVIYEIPNAFPFRGTTYIDSVWADAKANDPGSIRLPVQHEVSLSRALDGLTGTDATTNLKAALFSLLPEPMLLALATSSTDPEDLKMLAGLSCAMRFDPEQGQPVGLLYALDQRGRMRAVIHRRDLFEAVVNNPWLPDCYKNVLVLRPGVQGDSEVVGEVQENANKTHVFEYLRRNSYIPWGHFAANMANDAVRYAIRDLDGEDMRGLRHLYYQRTYVRMAEELGLAPFRRRKLTTDELEALRLQVVDMIHRALVENRDLMYTGTMWGWNFGFDFAPSGYRLHASHQQVHQQYALIPAKVDLAGPVPHGSTPSLPAFTCGDLIGDVVASYRSETGQGLFDDYLRALRVNQRTDGRPGESSLIVYQDDQVILFVPKAQASGWELQLMPLKPVGHILEADTACRHALDTGMLLAQRALEGLGARMVTSIEYSRRFDTPETGQRLLYAFLPKLPYAPGGFSEAQLRCVVGHYPEDFAMACRMALAERT
jgi:hypothetical protein